MNPHIAETSTQRCQPDTFWWGGEGFVAGYTSVRARSGESEADERGGELLEVSPAGVGEVSQGTLFGEDC